MRLAMANNYDELEFDYKMHLQLSNLNAHIQSRNRMSLTDAMTFLLVFTSFSVSLLHSQDSSSEFSPTDNMIRLGAIWDQQTTSLLSGTFECRVLRVKVPQEHNITRDEVRSLIKDLSQDLSAASLTRVSNALDPRLIGSEIPWSNKTYVFDGESVTIHESLLGASDLSKTFTRHNDYEIITRELNSRSSEQISIGDRGSFMVHVPKISDMVFIPPELLQREGKIMPIEGDNFPNRSQVSRGDFESAIVDTTSGFVYEYQRGTYGQLYFEVLQYLPTTFAGNIILPGIQMQSKYQGDRLRSFELRVIDRAAPNEVIEESAFVVKAKTENVIVDRVGRKKPVVSTGLDAEDATQLISFEEEDKKDELNFPRIFALGLLVLFLVLFLFFAVLLKHHRRRTASKKFGG